VLRSVVGAKREEVTGEWRKLRNEELRDFYSSSNISRVMNSWMRWECGTYARKYMQNFGREI
jgi:hypothetical protein